LPAVLPPNSSPLGIGPSVMGRSNVKTWERVRRRYLLCSLAQRLPNLRSTAAGILLFLSSWALDCSLTLVHKCQGLFLAIPFVSGCGDAVWFMFSRDLGCLLSFGVGWAPINSFGGLGVFIDVPFDC
jgi:hypothetical protein